MPQRRLLVLINPVSGQGKAVQDFQEHVQPLFELAEITFNAIVTGGEQQSYICFSYNFFQTFHHDVNNHTVAKHEVCARTRHVVLTYVCREAEPCQGTDEGV